MLKPPFEADLLREAADRFGTPTYLYATERIRAQVRQLQGALDGVPCRLLYAMKANANPAVLGVLRAEGLGVDAVSPGELILARRLGFLPRRILFSANNMTDEEMRMAHGSGAWINVGELSRLERLGHAYPGTAVCVRLNPKIGAGHHEHVVTAGERSKFGIPVEEAETIRAVAARYDLDVAGLHQHIGSGILDVDRIWEAIQVLLDVALTFPKLRFLNIGGGLGIPYAPDEAALDLDRFRSVITAGLRAFLDRHPSDELEIWLEPGRYLVAEAGVLLTRVNTLKTSYGRTYAGTDTGMNHLIRPTVYGAYHGIVNLSHEDGTPQPYDVTGNICESGDLLARDRPVAKIREGDLLAVLDAGAYGYAMASTYNLRPLPAEAVLERGGQLTLARRRLSPEALVDAWLE